MAGSQTEYDFLKAQTGQTGAWNDLYNIYLKNLGYTGTLQEMIAASGLGFAPSEPKWMRGTDLAFDFANNRQWAGSLNVVDTHAQTIYAPNAAGVYTPFAPNILTKTDLGIQTIPTRTQLFDSDPSDATGNLGNTTGTTITSNNVADPFGGIDGDKVEILGGSYKYWRHLAPVSASDRVGSLILRADAPTTIRLRMADDAGVDQVVVTCNLTTSWQTFQVAKNITAASFIEIGIDTRSGVAGGDDAAKTIYVAHRQLEAGLFASPPIRTASATVNGNQQVIDLTGRLGAGVAGFIQVDVSQLGSPNPRIFQITDGTPNNRVGLFYVGGPFAYFMVNGGVTQAQTSVATWPSGLATIAFAFGENFSQARMIGQSAVTADVVCTYPTGMDRIAIAGNGYDTAQNGFQLTKKLALKFGAQNQASFDAMYARALLA